MSFSLCKYKNMFGEVDTGAHSYKLGGIAVIDAAMTIIIAVLFAWFSKSNVWITLVIFFLIGIFAHRLFCVRTTVDRMLFP